MRTLLILALTTCLATAASAQAPSARARTQTIPLPSVQDAAALQRTADQRWNAVFSADRAFTQAVRDAIGAEIGVRRSRGENVAQLEVELRQLSSDTQMSFNMQYLQLQSQMQAENRSYTAISNIIQMKHDTARNAISNVR